MEKFIYKVEWFSPLNDNNKLIYYMKTLGDIQYFIGTTLTNSKICIQPVLVLENSNEYIESLRWHYVYENKNENFHR